MDKQARFAVIGPGVMAEAMIAGLIRTKVTLARLITAAGPRQERGEELVGELHLTSRQTCGVCVNRLWSLSELIILTAPLKGRIGQRIGDSYRIVL